MYTDKIHFSSNLSVPWTVDKGHYKIFVSLIKKEIIYLSFLMILETQMAVLETRIALVTYRHQRSK